MKKGEYPWDQPIKKSLYSIIFYQGAGGESGERESEFEGEPFTDLRESWCQIILRGLVKTSK